MSFPFKPSFILIVLTEFWLWNVIHFLLKYNHQGQESSFQLGISLSFFLYFIIIIIIIFLAFLFQLSLSGNRYTGGRFIHWEKLNIHLLSSADSYFLIPPFQVLFFDHLICFRLFSSVFLLRDSESSWLLPGHFLPNLLISWVLRFCHFFGISADAYVLT